MTRFAEGTNQDYQNAFNNWWFRGGAEAGLLGPQRGSYGADRPPTSGGGAQSSLPTPQRGSYGAGRQPAFGGGTQKPLNMGAYGPGKAQPIQPQSQGTPYAAATLSPQPMQPQPPYGATQQSPYSSYNSFTTPPISAPPQGSQASPGFRTTTYGFDGSPMAPDQFYQQRDALIQLLNDDNARYQMQSGVGPGPGSGFQTPDFGAMWSQAGNMVQQGWKNPFASMFG